MHENIPIDRAVIEEKLQQVSHDYYFLRAQQLELEKQQGWFVKSGGILVESLVPQSDELTRSDDRFVTTGRLRGTARKLNAPTLIVARSLHLPRDMSSEGIGNFIEDYQHSTETTRVLGYVALNEPGVPIFAPSRMKVSRYYETTETGMALASEGISMYLNSASNFGNSVKYTESISNDMSRTYAALQAHTAESLDMLYGTIEPGFGQRSLAAE